MKTPNPPKGRKQITRKFGGFWCLGALVANKRINKPSNRGNTKSTKKENESSHMR